MRDTHKTAADAPCALSWGNRRPSIPVMTALILLLIAAFIFSLTIGRYGIPLDQLMRIFFEKIFGTAELGTVGTVLFNVRIPRILCAIMIGAALAGSGAAYQGIFRNPMVSPDILGASAGAGFGAAFAILNSFNILSIEITAFIFGLAAVGLTYGLSSIIGRNSTAVLVLVLTGMVVQSLFSAFTSITKFVADPNNKLQEITFWLMGGLNSITNREVLMMLVPFVIGLIPLFLFRWKINVLSFGEEEAKAMGVDTSRVRLILILASTLLTSSAISVAGMVGWVGLIIPHLARLIVGPDYKVLMPASVLIGGTFLLMVDNVARTAFVTEVPLGILTAIIGAPFFLYLLMKGRSAW
ncbi:iron ABC transporter permease [Dehalobacter sp. DCM]|uniref:FecCD family ABC transporter permease n=1 Tax=Dehalobacter sp. DCM TaxID=2907827 RepID=UPI0030812B76|nr:iron ABC transporter permease [Dehalobacter sp. DCM]